MTTSIESAFKADLSPQKLSALLYLVEQEIRVGREKMAPLLEVLGDRFFTPEVLETAASIVEPIKAEDRLEEIKRGETEPSRLSELGRKLGLIFRALAKRPVYPALPPAQLSDILNLNFSDLDFNLNRDDISYFCGKGANTIAKMILLAGNDPEAVDYKIAEHILDCIGWKLGQLNKKVKKEALGFAIAEYLPDVEEGPLPTTEMLQTTARLARAVVKPKDLKPEGEVFKMLEALRKRADKVLHGWERSKEDLFPETVLDLKIDDLYVGKLKEKNTAQNFKARGITDLARLILYAKDHANNEGDKTWIDEAGKVVMNFGIDLEDISGEDIYFMQVRTMNQDCAQALSSRDFKKALDIFKKAEIQLQPETYADHHEAIRAHIAALMTRTDGFSIKERFDRVAKMIRLFKEVDFGEEVERAIEGIGEYCGHVAMHLGHGDRFSNIWTQKKMGKNLMTLKKACPGLKIKKPKIVAKIEWEWQNFGQYDIHHVIKILGSVLDFSEMGELAQKKCLAYFEKNEVESAGEILLTFGPHVDFSPLAEQLAAKRGKIIAEIKKNLTHYYRDSEKKYLRCAENLVKTYGPFMDLTGVVDGSENPSSTWKIDKYNGELERLRGEHSDPIVIKKFFTDHIVADLKYLPLN